MVDSPLIRRVLAPNPSVMTGRGTNTYLIGASQLAVVDPGPDLPEHLDAILREAGDAPIEAIFVTHRHSDHLPAALPLSERTGAPLYGHPDLPGVQRPLIDGQVLTVGEFSVRAVATPGHTPEHHCYVLREAKAIFCGDLMAGSGTVVVGGGEGELAQYLSSLRRLASLKPERIFPGHGPTIDSPSVKIQEYLDHRGLRERQVMEALTRGPSSIQEIRALLYPDISSELISAAENNVHAHLLKLRSQGRAIESNGQWSLRMGD